jgi:hypothetical protein
MNKAELDFLEKVFADQIEGRWQTYKSKVAKRMEEDGLVFIDREVRGKDIFGPIVVEGHRLSIFGNHAYCTSDRCKGPFDEGE